MPMALTRLVSGCGRDRSSGDRSMCVVSSAQPPAERAPAQPVQQVSRAVRIAVTYIVPSSDALELEVVDLAAQPPVAVAQLAVEQVERGVEHPSGRHRPALVMIISGIVATATSTRITRYTVAMRVEEAAVGVLVAHVARVVGDDEDREVGQRQRRRRQHDRVLGDLDRVDAAAGRDARRRRWPSGSRGGSATPRAGAGACPTASRGTGPRCSRPTAPSPGRRRTWPRRCRRAPTARPSLPTIAATGRATWDSWSTPMSRRRQHEVGARHDRQRQQPAEREADEHVGPVLVEVARRPAVLDRAAGEEEHLVRRHRRAEQGDAVVGVGERRLAGRHVGAGDV